MLIILVSVFSVSPFITAVGWIKFDLDPYHHLFRDIIKNKIINILVRIFLLTGLGEACRCICHIACGLCFTWANYCKCLSILQCKRVHMSTIKAIQVHIQLVLTWNLMHKPVEKISSIVISVAFWEGTLVIWMMIRLADYIPLVIYIWFGLAAVGILGAVVGALSVASTISELSEHVVEMLRESGRFKISMAKCGRDKKSSKYEWKKAIALKPIKFPFQPFLYVNREFVLDYLSRLKDRVVDALLIL